MSILIGLNALFSSSICLVICQHFSCYFAVIQFAMIPIYNILFQWVILVAIEQYSFVVEGSRQVGASVCGAHCVIYI